MNSAATVQAHYGEDDLTTQVARALEGAGLTAETLPWSDVAAFDQFHVRGLAATEEMADCLQLEEGASVLDVGCGLGGPARYLAAVRSCQVTGIDLSRPFIAVAQLLAARTGLADRTTFLQGDALALPFPAENFDYAWTQHVSMNIADRAGLYAGIHRVLKPGGRLAIYDVLLGSGEPLHYPLPWARRPEISFLLTPNAMRDVLHQSGFTEISWKDTTEVGLAWLAQQQPTRQSADTLTLGVVMGPEFPTMAANLGRNLKEGRARLVQTVLQRNDS